jgi:hypothetical protein
MMTAKRKGGDPFERYAGEPVTTTRRYAVPVPVLKAIRNVTPQYGSQGRALQVGTEILIRMKRRVQLKSIDGVPMTRMTFKLLPRTIDLIDELAEQYGDPARVFCAALHVLQPETKKRR